MLGLLIEQPDYGFSLEQRLEERFPAARFAYSTAYNALRRLRKDGLVRVAEPDPTAAEAEEVFYEATPEGVEHFRDWVRASTGSPIQREELHAKIAMCEPRDLPRLIDVLYAEERACIAELERIRARTAAEQRGAGRRALAEVPWSELMGRGIVHGEAAFWGGRITQLAPAAQLPGAAAQGGRAAGAAGGTSTRAPAGSADGMSELLRLTDVSKRYRRGWQDLHVLRGAGLRVERGEVVCVLGTRGQGKTTLLQIAAGMESPDAGVVCFDGQDLAALSDAGLSRLLGRQIAWAGRSGPRMRTRMLDYVAMPLLVGQGGRARRRLGRREGPGRGAGGQRSERDVYARARAALERVGAPGCAEQGWESMSDWERALAEVAQAIAGEPALLLVDDLTDALGVRETDELCGLLRSLSGESQMGVLMAVSDAQATLFSDRITDARRGSADPGPAVTRRERDRVPRSRVRPPRRRARQHLLVLELRELVKHYRSAKATPSGRWTASR